MSVIFFLGILVSVGLVIYLHLNSKKRSWHLDKNGVLKEESIGHYGFLAIKKEDFEWVQDVFKKYFPEGYCTIQKHTGTDKHILIVTTSLYHHQYYIRDADSDDLLHNGWQNIMESIFYIEQSIEEDRYYLYLRRPCSIAIGQDEIIFKGRIVEGAMVDLKRGFDDWQRDQKAFAEKHQNEIKNIKNQILAKQKEYDSQVYKFPEV